MNIENRVTAMEVKLKYLLIIASAHFGLSIVPSAWPPMVAIFGGMF